MAEVTAVLFDVDGTLVDTNYLHAVTWWEAFTMSGFTVPMSNIHRAIGMGGDQLLDHLLPADRDRDGDAGIQTAHDALFSVYWQRLRPLPGAASLLRACKQRDQRVVLATSARPPELAAMRAVLDAEDAIDEVTSSADVEHSKPAPDIVEVALRKAAVSESEALFVGDTVWDVQACQRAGVPCLAMLSGGFGRDELLAAGALQVYEGPADLLDQITQTPLASRRKKER
jgi:HAD superfamily hydrolase (TIGR01509 family)